MRTIGPTVVLILLLLSSVASPFPSRSFSLTRSRPFPYNFGARATNIRGGAESEEPEVGSDKKSRDDGEIDEEGEGKEGKKDEFVVFEAESPPSQSNDTQRGAKTEEPVEAEIKVSETRRERR